MNDDATVKHSVEDTGEGSGEDRYGMRWLAVLHVHDPKTGLKARHVLAQCATREIAQEVCKWADSREAYGVDPIEEVRRGNT